jgi:hypothetical protein
LRRQLSALVNFARFRETKLEVYLTWQQETDTLLEQQAALSETNAKLVQMLSAPCWSCLAVQQCLHGYCFGRCKDVQLLVHANSDLTCAMVCTYACFIPWHLCMCRKKTYSGFRTSVQHRNRCVLLPPLHIECSEPVVSRPLVLSPCSADSSSVVEHGVTIAGSCAASG